MSVLDFVTNYMSAHNGVVEGLRQEIFSQPLISIKSPFNGSDTSLSPSEVIRLTNVERAKVGASTLQENVLLDQAATKKVQDMFDRQYFEHISPDGKGPGALSDSVGYRYLVVGENLALGNFKDNEDLIAAWMASPGHRENMLNTRFMEMGVAVGNGIYNGSRVWLAVQEFGKPLSQCPAINNSLRLQVESDKNIVTNMANDLARQKKDLDSTPRQTPAEAEAYNTKVADYNAAVVKYNTALENLKSEINTYNQQVRNFNSCATE